VRTHLARLRLRDAERVVRTSPAATSGVARPFFVERDVDRAAGPFAGEGEEGRRSRLGMVDDEGQDEVSARHRQHPHVRHHALSALPHFRASADHVYR
jgi:hypothetical protein